MKKSIKKWLIPVIAVIVAAIAVVILFATGVIGSSNVEVPDVVKLNFEEAQEILEEEGLFICITERETNNVFDENTVLAQSPESGVKVKKGTVINVTVSEWSVETTIPDVEFYDKSLAIDVLQNAGFRVEIVEEENESYAKGTVISQSQTGKGQTGSVITIVVSKNDKQETEEIVKVPSLTGKTLPEANELSGDKLYIKVVDEIFSDTVKKGAVVSQNPTEGVDAKGNSVIELEISKGKASDVIVTMPDVIHSSRMKAKETLEKLGLKVTVKEEYAEKIPVGVVFAQSIPAGEEITADTAVTISVNNGIKPEVTTQGEMPTKFETTPKEETTKKNNTEKTTKKTSTTAVPDTQISDDKAESKYVADFAITTDKTEAKAGDVITVSVKLKTNYKIVAISLPVIYDASIFEIVGAEEGNLASFLNFTGTLKENAYTTNGNWQSPDNMYNKNSNEEYWNSTLIKTRYKIAFATWVATPSQGTVVTTLDKEETIVTFKLRVKENVSDTTGKVYLSQDFIKTAEAPQGILSVGRLKSDTITADSIVATGQTIDLRDAVAMIKIK